MKTSLNVLESWAAPRWAGIPSGDVGIFVADVAIRLPKGKPPSARTHDNRRARLPR
jgi:hypothetical protein